MSTLSIDPATTALVLIDLQQGIVGRPSAPRPGSEVVLNAQKLASLFRKIGAPVVLVHVCFHPDFKDILNLPVDTPMQLNKAALPPNWTEFVPELDPQPSDIVIPKRQWGAFYGTELDLQLRRRGIRTIVLGGISTEIGVESTARDAYERGYAQVLVEDAMASATAAAHEFTIKSIFPRLGMVRSTAEVLSTLPA